MDAQLGVSVCSWGEVRADQLGTSSTVYKYGHSRSTHLLFQLQENQPAPFSCFIKGTFIQNVNNSSNYTVICSFTDKMYTQCLNQRVGFVSSVYVKNTNMLTSSWTNGDNASIPLTGCRNYQWVINILFPKSSKEENPLCVLKWLFHLITMLFLITVIYDDLW